MPGSLEESKVDRSVALLSKLAGPVAGGGDPVGRTQRRTQQADSQTAHKEGHEQQRTTLKVHRAAVLLSSLL